MLAVSLEGSTVSIPPPLCASPLTNTHSSEEKEQLGKSESGAEPPVGLLGVGWVCFSLQEQKEQGRSNVRGSAAKFSARSLPHLHTI